MRERRAERQFPPQYSADNAENGRQPQQCSRALAEADASKSCKHAEDDYSQTKPDEYLNGPGLVRRVMGLGHFVGLRRYELSGFFARLHKRSLVEAQAKLSQQIRSRHSGRMRGTVGERVSSGASLLRRFVSTNALSNASDKSGWAVSTASSSQSGRSR